MNASFDENHAPRPIEFIKYCNENNTNDEENIYVLCVVHEMQKEEETRNSSECAHIKDAVRYNIIIYGVFSCKITLFKEETSSTTIAELFQKLSIILNEKFVISWREKYGTPITYKQFDYTLSELNICSHENEHNLYLAAVSDISSYNATLYQIAMN